jgi:thioredoxin-related protein
MKSIVILSLFFIAGLMSSGYVFYFNSSEQTSSTITWHTFQEAVELNKKEKKKIFIDVYTDWCGWCKVMDKNTFTHPLIVKYMNEKFYAVKLNAEMKDTIVFNNTVFVNPNPNYPRSTHQLAASLLNNRMSYPTTVFLDENFNLLTQVPGYLQPAQLEPILSYFGENIYLKMKYDEFQKTFKSEIAPSDGK